jgi:hypothetical protein
MTAMAKKPQQPQMKLPLYDDDDMDDIREVASKQIDALADLLSLSLKREMLEKGPGRPKRCRRNANAAGAGVPSGAAGTSGASSSSMQVSERTVDVNAKIMALADKFDTIELQIPISIAIKIVPAIVDLQRTVQTELRVMKTDNATRNDAAKTRIINEIEKTSQVLSSDYSDVLKVFMVDYFATLFAKFSNTYRFIKHVKQSNITAIGQIMLTLQEAKNKLKCGTVQAGRQDGQAGMQDGGKKSRRPPSAPKRKPPLPKRKNLR